MEQRPPADRARSAVGWFALVYVVLHHSGTLFTPLGNVPLGGSVGQTRWADWLDLPAPYLLVLLAGWALFLTRAAPRWWLVFAVGAITYVEGHGVHLSANSIGNRQPSPLVHLWDETVGHHFQHIGLPLMIVALCATVGRDRRRFRLLAAAPLAVLVGMTQMTNALEGGTVPVGMAVSAGLAYWGWCWRDRAAAVLLWAYGPALLTLLAYGVVRGGFAPPSAR